MNKILIIDDSEEILFAISEFFKFKDWETFTASNVEIGMKYLQEVDVDIILIDFHMPYINGVVGVRLIRQIKPFTPIIALTVEGKENIAEDFFQAGADDFAIKPIKVLDLYSRINVHLLKSNHREISTVKELNYPKGINKNTMDIIRKSMVKEKQYITVEMIADKTGLASKTINRYMNFMVEEKMVEIKIIYGKIGRPRNEYLWIN